MATFSYRCAQDGLIDVVRPVGTALPRTACPTCGNDAVRVFTAPMLSLASPALVAAIDRSERTREQPDVVAGPPSMRAPQVRTPRNPALARLPRP
jgi:hypothetical protein